MFEHPWAHLALRDGGTTAHFLSRDSQPKPSLNNGYSELLLGTRLVHRLIRAHPRVCTLLCGRLRRPGFEHPEHT